MQVLEEEEEDVDETDEEENEKNEDFFANDNLAQQFVYNQENNRRMEESKNKINLGGVSNKDIREELETAINQATKHYDDFMNQN